MSFRKIETLISLTKGKKPLNILQNVEDSYLPYVDIKAFETGIVDNYTDGEKCVSCNEGDLLIVCDGSRSGLVGKAITGYVGSTLARIDVSDEIDINYLYYFIQGKYQILNTNVKGTGTPHLKQDLLKSFNIYLPPIEKQKLIVAKIEELFSKLDKGVEELNKIKEQLKIYRQAVLDQAFDNNETEVHLRDISTVISGYAFKSGLYDANGKYVVVKIGNVKQHSFDFSRDLTKTNEANDNILSKYLLKKGCRKSIASGQPGFLMYSAVVHHKRNQTVDIFLFVSNYFQLRDLPIRKNICHGYILAQLGLQVQSVTLSGNQLHSAFALFYYIKKFVDI